MLNKLDYKSIIKGIITLILFYFLFSYVDIDELIAVLAKSHGGFLLIGVLLQIASTYLAAYRWQLIMKMLGFKETLSFYVKSYFKGTYFNQILPSSIGGDAVRMIELSALGYDKKDVVYGVSVDRVLGLIGLLVLNFFSNILFFGSFPLWFYQLINLITVSGLVGFSLLFFIDKITFIKEIKLINIFYRLAVRLNNLYTSKTVLIKHILISVLVQLLSVLVVYSVALSIEVKITLDLFLIAIPPIFLLTIIPISLAGWGVREGGMIGVFMLIGADKEEILALSIIYGLLLMISALPGAYMWVKSKKST